MDPKVTCLLLGYKSRPFLGKALRKTFKFERQNNRQEEVVRREIERERIFQLLAHATDSCNSYTGPARNQKTRLSFPLEMQKLKLFESAFIIHSLHHHQQVLELGADRECVLPKWWSGMLGHSALLFSVLFDF